MLGTTAFGFWCHGGGQQRAMSGIRRGGDEDQQRGPGAEEVETWIQLTKK